MSGPLTGRRVLELAGIGPAPFAATMLADMGAEVVRIDRPEARKHAGPSGAGLTTTPTTIFDRGRRRIAVNLKDPQGKELVLSLVETADVFLEGFRPGVVERLGIGPRPCLDRNPRLVYGRVTGWGQDGPLAKYAGHDINYLAVSGLLSLLGEQKDPPLPPLNLLADYAGGAMMVAYGILCALLERSESGQGQVVDSAMVEGAAFLGGVFWGLTATGAWGERGTNRIDGGAPYYNTYATADGKYVALGAVEPKFYAEMLSVLGLSHLDENESPLPDQDDRAAWPAMKELIGSIIRTETRDEWCRRFDGHDACFAPVLSTQEAMGHRHIQERQLFLQLGGVPQPGPVPRFSRTQPTVEPSEAAVGQNSQQILIDWGIGRERGHALQTAGVVS